MADPSGAAGLLPAMLGQPRWHLEPGELLTALVLLAKEVLPACLEMSCWQGGGHCPCLPPSAPPGCSRGDGVKPCHRVGGLNGGLLSCLGWGSEGQSPAGEADEQGSDPAGFAALVGWSMRKNDGTLGTLGCLKKVYWHWLISPGAPCWRWPPRSPRTKCCRLGGRWGGLADLMEGL